MAKANSPAARPARRKRSHLPPPEVNRSWGVDTAVGADAAPVVPALVWAESLVPPAGRSSTSEPPLDDDRYDTSYWFSMAPLIRLNWAPRSDGFPLVVTDPPAAPPTRRLSPDGSNSLEAIPTANTAAWAPLSAATACCSVPLLIESAPSERRTTFGWRSGRWS